MAATSVPTSEFKELELSDPCTLGGSMESELHTALACESEHATTSSSSFLTAGSESVLMGTESREGTSISEREEQIERSKGHWSELSELSFNSNDEGAAEIENREVFKTLQMDHVWGNFFQTFGYATEKFGSAGELEVGEKFAEGGQAELYHAHVKWHSPEDSEKDKRNGTEWVLKVFKKGTLLRHLQSQWPSGYLEYIAENLKRTQLGKPAPFRYHCSVMYATLLKDGRFAFLMVKEQEDLRCVIDYNMWTNTGKNHGPFRKDIQDAEMIMFRIALGMDWLHNCNIVHRDLKASNVLMSQHKVYKTWMCVVADFECSIGIVGTGFWRAPEILQAIKEKNISKRPGIFSKEVDVYAYGMTCYEILTGKLPFEGHPWRDYDLVLNGTRPKVPEYVDDWACELLHWCWQSNPTDRPSFGDILNLLSANSARVRRYKEQNKI